MSPGAPRQGALRHDGGGFPPLTAAEVRVARQDLGFTADSLAAVLGVARRSVHRWEQGHVPVPRGVADQMGVLTDHADGQVAGWVARLLDVPDPVLRIPRTGELDGFPAGWWTALAARIVEQVPGCRVVYADEQVPGKSLLSTT